MVRIKVKWNKEVLDVDVDTSDPVDVFKAQLQSITNVPASNQKIMGVKGGQLKDDANLAEVGLTEGKTLLLIGSAAAAQPASAAATAIVFDEDRRGQDASSATSNGLENLGNTCYLNSALQLLRQVPDIREILPFAMNPVERQLALLYKNLDGTKETVKPFNFLTTFIGAFPSFGERDDRGHMMQHDSQEALGHIISMLVETCSTRVPQQMPGERVPFLQRLLQGEYVETVRKLGSEGEDNTTTKFVPFTILPCNLEGEVQTIETGLEKGLEEQIAGKSADGSDAMFLRTCRFSQLPEYMFVNIVRFQWKKGTQQKCKILRPVTFPMVLDVYTLCAEKLQKELDPMREVVKQTRDEEVERRKRARQKTFDDEDAKAKEKDEEKRKEALAKVPLVPGNITGYYELCGVISHKGRDADGGHYVCWAKKNQSWLVFDDEHVGPVSEDAIRQLRGVGEGHVAYVLMYRTRDPVTKETPLPI